MQAYTDTMMEYYYSDDYYDDYFASVEWDQDCPADLLKGPAWRASSGE